MVKEEKNLLITILHYSFSIDQFVEWDSNEFLYKMNETDADGGIVSFRGTHQSGRY